MYESRENFASILQFNIIYIYLSEILFVYLLYLQYITFILSRTFVVIVDIVIDILS